VLAGAGLGDDARLAHALGEQRLAERVVDLVRAGVVEVLALEVERIFLEPGRKIAFHKHGLDLPHGFPKIFRQQGADFGGRLCSMQLEPG
jgi:hypothetical protein